MNILALALVQFKQNSILVMIALQDLDLSYNQISRLQSDVFSSLTSLVFLRLRGNWLTNIPGELFGSLARLSVLDLSHNFVENVSSKVQRYLETRISTLRLEGKDALNACRLWML